MDGRPRPRMSKRPAVDRRPKSRTAILWPSSQRLRHRAKGRLSLGDLVGRTRSEPPGTTTGTAKASAATMRVEAVCDVDRRCVSALELQCPLPPCRIPARESMASEWPQPSSLLVMSDTSGLSKNDFGLPLLSDTQSDRAAARPSCCGSCNLGSAPARGVPSNFEANYSLP